MSGRSPKLLPAREAALLALIEIEQQGAYANLAYARVVSEHRLSAPDLALTAELVYGTTRMKLALDAIAARFLSKPIAQLPPQILLILRLSLYQLHYLDGVAEFAAVNEGVQLAKKYGGQPLANLVNGVLRNYLRSERERLLPDKGGDTRAYLSVTLSHPRWLIDYLAMSWGDDKIEAFCRYNNRHHPLVVRVNTLLTDRDTLLAKLRAAGREVEPAAHAPQGLILPESGNIAAAAEFEAGELIVQGEASQLAALALDPAPDSVTLDLCAAPGGKATYLAALMENKGCLYAVDVHQHKQRLIADNARRMRTDIIRPVAADARALGAAYAACADYLLLDAPCSGLGVLSARADSRWRKSRADIDELAALSYQLLEAAAGYVKPGGRLVYSTCTVTREENINNIRRFLEACPQFSLTPLTALKPHFDAAEQPALDKGYIQLLPQKHDMEGFFIAALQKAK
ncbi:MAG: 16S rRNA (cytosine(967)-C(5))-methyltransferase RsmB [Bacillota bacterium]|nr:16S rRNA (cytosine(967)-C(5))-methyltransferase RsmB [Bacillota bacterium]